MTVYCHLSLQGLFLTLVVSLLSRQEEPFFIIDSGSLSFPKQLRHAVKLYSEDIFGSIIMCENYQSIEIYFTGPPQHCRLLRKVILDGLSACAKVLRYNENALDVSANVRCNRKHSIPDNDKEPHPITISYKTNPPAIGCSKESDLPVIFKVTEKQECWLKGKS